MKARLIALVVATASLTACGPAADESTDPAPSASPSVVSVAALKGPTTMGLAWMLDHQDSAAGVGFELSLHGAPDEITPGLIKGETMLAAIPANLAAVLYAKGAKIKVAAVNTLGVLHIVTKNESVEAIWDLAGKKVLSTGKGTTPQWVLEYLLAENGVEAQVEYLSEASEVAARLTAEEAAIAVLPEPYVTTVLAKDPSLELALDLTDEWDKISQTQLVTGVLVVADQFAEQDSAAFEAFLDEYRQSIDYTNANPDQVAPLIEELGIVPSAELAQTAIPRSHLAFLGGQDCKAAVSAYLAVLHQADPESVGGALPGNDFYYAA
ncbi:MAG: ABC transporter substrate-binding protein [Bifidobacteriaceae bacterium]|jgi:NitT/TauT family transport system substrate-binding protein|nr:ABC transporter substrate-binding protein [Bifidobacteriaceae bacterium]